MKKWSVAQLNKSEAVNISESMGIPMLLSILLNIRGLRDEESIRRFLSDEVLFHDPMTVKDMDKAVNRIKDAIEDGEKICVYGDYDADGVTATALLYSYLSSAGADVMYYIPSRSDEGYGMNIEAIAQLKSENVSLIVTVDNGISAMLEIEYANSLGIDTVITDHHTVPEEIPDAVAVVDLHREDCESTFKELSGVGVALKLVMAIEGEYCDLDTELENYADIAALGTIGDIVSLTDENRTIVKEGVKRLKNTERAGIRALLKAAGYENKPVTSGSLAFSVVPRINAVGRLGLSNKSVDLLLTDDEAIAAELAGILTEDNCTRQQIERKILAEIDELIRSDSALTKQRIIIIDGDNWHQGVIGIVAARVKSAYGKPCIIISREGEVARASGRSVEGFSLFDAIYSCNDLLIHYGGHPMAVGFSLDSENIDLFKEAMYEYTDSLEEMPLPVLNIDCKLNPALLDLSLLDSITALEPFGAGNPLPVFGLYNMNIVDIKEISGGKHRRLTVTRGDKNISVMCFNTDPDNFGYYVGDTVDLAVTLDRNEYADTVSLSIIARDIKLSSIDNEAMLLSERVFEKVLTGKSVTVSDARSILPQREDFALVYRTIRQSNGFRGNLDILCARLPMSLGKLRVVLTAMSEQGLCEIYEGLYSCEIILTEVDGKVNIEKAPIIEELKEMCI